MAEDSGGVSGIGIAAVFAGGILVWSGVKGYSVSGVFRDLIAGKQPSSLPPANPVSVSGLLSAINPVKLLSTSGGSSGSGSAVMVGQGTGAGWTAHDRGVFARSLLATIGAPQTSANINSILAWINHEGGGGTNNPLNTTLAMGGSTSFNSVGVQNFSSLSIGVAANARTLLGGGYSDILSALRSGGGLCGRSFAGLSTWSGGGYSSVC
jgi:hypothetical protein